MLVKFFLWLNSLFPEIKHPFNIPTKTSVYNLNYSDFEYEQTDKLISLYEKIIPFKNWLKNKKICDFACGGGGKSVYFAEIGAEKVIGIDLSQNFIMQAHALAKSKNLEDKCEFFVGDVCETNLENEYFDAVIFNDAIDHINDPEKAVKEALRILKPNGVTLINFESYYFPFGHHLLDGIRIPWIHLFTTESFRMKLYAKAVERFPDALRRIEFRKNYLNKLSLRKFRRLINKLQDENPLDIQMTVTTFRNPVMKVLSKIPQLNELFLSTILCVIRKHS